MADYTDLPDSAVGVGGIPSGTTVTALRDNPIAIAEGAPGAPKVVNAAVFPAGQFLRLFTTASLSTTGAGEFTTATVSGGVDMDDVATLKLDCGITAPVSSTRLLRVQFSTDGGSTWQAATTITSVTAGATGAVAASVSAYVDMDTGVVSVNRTSPSSTVAGAATGAGTPPFNAIRFLSDAANMEFSVIGYCISRRPEV